MLLWLNESKSLQPVSKILLKAFPEECRLLWQQIDANGFWSEIWNVYIASLMQGSNRTTCMPFEEHAPVVILAWRHVTHMCRRDFQDHNYASAWTLSLKGSRYHERNILSLSLSLSFYLISSHLSTIDLLKNTQKEKGLRTHLKPSITPHMLEDNLKYSCPWRPWISSENDIV